MSKMTKESEPSSEAIKLREERNKRVELRNKKIRRKYEKSGL